MESATALWSTMHAMTSIKRQELAKQRDAAKALRRELLEPVNNEAHPRERVRLLLKDAGKRVPADEADPARLRGRTRDIQRKQVSTQHAQLLQLAGISPSNVQRFLEQSEQDASIPPAFFAAIEQRFRDALRAQEIKYEYATLFSDLVTERAAEQPTSSIPTVGNESEFETVGRAEMQEQRKEWESLVFSPLEIKESLILSTLETTFSSPEARQSLESLRKEMGTFCHDLSRSTVDQSDMRTVVGGLIATDLLSQEQAAILKQMRDSPTSLNEMADVLNLRIASIERWSWETEAIPLEMRRQLNGKYRVFMHEEITQALLLYYIGIKFAVRFAHLLDVFRASTGWRKHRGVGHDEQVHFDYFVGNRMPVHSNIEGELNQKFAKDYFMSILPRDVEDGAGGYGDDALDDTKRNIVQHSIDSKQDLLQLIVAESLLAERLQEEMIVMQTDFRWFGPNLSHSTIFAVLKFFGVTDEWRTFFAKFLRAPMRFTQDGSGGAIRTRARGVPMSHTLSDFLSEAAMFCVDFAVNEATLGRPMFRMHDDVWFWGNSKETVAAWGALIRITKTMGIEINTEKTGAARLTRNKKTAIQPLPKSLPIGPLRWGLLSVQKGGQFSIDQAKVDEHVAELRRQLKSRRSILAWIKAYNTYMRFFHMQFCRPGQALGRNHVDDCLATLSRINHTLFPTTDGNVAQEVKAMIKARFDVQDIPDGFIYFPMLLGGLDLHNPFISLQGVRESVEIDPAEKIDEALRKEEVEYRRLEGVFEKHGAANRDALNDRPRSFMTREEFVRHRREKLACFAEVWRELLQPAEEESVEETDEITKLLQKLSGEQTRETRLHKSGPYWKAIVELYGLEMGEVFGSVQVVEKGLLPLGMVGLFQGKVRWEA